MASIPACQLNCLNGGYCDYISSDESTLIDTFARGGLIQRCICLPGFGGISCENKVEQCSTELKCQNGVPCALDEKTGKHYCDCSYADLISLFAGKMCREPATSYCGQGDIKNRSFCTHGGLCQSNINRGVYFDMSNKYSTWVQDMHWLWMCNVVLLRLSTILYLMLYLLFQSQRMRLSARIRRRSLWIPQGYFSWWFWAGSNRRVCSSRRIGSNRRICPYPNRTCRAK